MNESICQTALWVSPLNHLASLEEAKDLEHEMFKAIGLREHGEILLPSSENYSNCIEYTVFSIANLPAHWGFLMPHMERMYWATAVFPLPVRAIVYTIFEIDENVTLESENTTSEYRSAVKTFKKMQYDNAILFQKLASLLEVSLITIRVSTAKKYALNILSSGGGLNLRTSDLVQVTNDFASLSSEILSALHISPIESSHVVDYWDISKKDKFIIHKNCIGIKQDIPRQFVVELAEQCLFQRRDFTVWFDAVIAPELEQGLPDETLPQRQLLFDDIDISICSGQSRMIFQADKVRAASNPYHIYIEIDGRIYDSFIAFNGKITLSEYQSRLQSNWRKRIVVNPEEMPFGKLTADIDVLLSQLKEQISKGAYRS